MSEQLIEAIKGWLQEHHPKHLKGRTVITKKINKAGKTITQEKSEENPIIPFLADHVVAENIELLSTGRILFTLTRHESLCDLDAMNAHLNGKAYKRVAVQQVNERVDWSIYEPHITPHKSKFITNILFCTLTGSNVNKNKADIEKHISGWAYQRALASANEFQAKKEAKRLKAIEQRRARMALQNRFLTPGTSADKYDFSKMDFGTMISDNDNDEDDEVDANDEDDELDEDMEFDDEDMEFEEIDVEDVPPPTKKGAKQTDFDMSVLDLSKKNQKTGKTIVAQKDIEKVLTKAEKAQLGKKNQTQAPTPTPVTTKSLKQTMQVESEDEDDFDEDSFDFDAFGEGEDDFDHFGKGEDLEGLGQYDEDGNFIPGIFDEEGEFIPGIFDGEGEFEPGMFSEDGSFIPFAYLAQHGEGEEGDDFDLNGEGEFDDEEVDMNEYFDDDGIMYGGDDDEDDLDIAVYGEDGEIDAENSSDLEGLFDDEDFEDEDFEEDEEQFLPPPPPTKKGKAPLPAFVAKSTKPAPKVVEKAPLKSTKAAPAAPVKFTKSMPAPVKSTKAAAPAAPVKSTKVAPAAPVKSTKTVSQPAPAPVKSTKAAAPAPVKSTKVAPPAAPAAPVKSTKVAPAAPVKSTKTVSPPAPTPPKKRANDIVETVVKKQQITSQKPTPASATKKSAKEDAFVQLPPAKNQQGGKKSKF